MRHLFYNMVPIFTGLAIVLSPLWFGYSAYNLLKLVVVHQWFLNWLTFWAVMAATALAIAFIDGVHTAHRKQQLAAQVQDEN